MKPLVRRALLALWAASLLAGCASTPSVTGGSVSTGPTDQPSQAEPSAGSTPIVLSSSVITAVPCRTADLRISVTNTSAAAGNVGGYLLFVNTSGKTCTLQGAPTLIALTTAGAATRAGVAQAVFTPFPTLASPPLVILAPGDRAFAAYGGSDTPAGPSATCPPSYHSFRVAVPHDPTESDLPAFNTWLGQDQPSCAGIDVTVIASASEVQPFADLSSLRP